MKFTREDDEILLSTMREAREIAAAEGKDVELSENKIFQDLESKASTCTYVYTFIMSY